MQLDFYKYEGAGNDFILIDDRTAFFPIENSSLIQRLCHRQMGIGADGVILLQNSQNQDADFRMRIFNSDGKEASMCGNGLRCLIQFIHSLGFEKSPLSIQTKHAILTCYKEGESIRISMGMPEVREWELELPLKNETLSVYVLHTGVPHAVVFVTDLEKVDVEKVGREVRNHPYFAPEGVNVNFAYAHSQNQIQVRTYERGVEAETLACGTGATAVGFVSHQLQKSDSPVSILTRSNEVLRIHCKNDDVFLEGPAKFVFQGRFFIH
jgi:diaminopimelate epimerase